MSIFSKDTIEEEHKKKQADFQEEDVETVLDEEEKIKSKFESKNALRRYFDDAQLLFNLVRDYASG